MAILGFRKVVSHEDAASKDIVASYQRLRPIRLSLNNELVRRLSRDVLNDGAKRIGILHGGTFVFDNEDETSVLMDYCIHDVYRNGRNAVEQYLCDCSTDPNSDEMTCLRAMQSATYALVVVLGVEPGIGCNVRNLFSDETRLLADMGFSRTAQPGAVIATRLLDFGSFLATGGAALPVGIFDESELREWQRKLREGEDDHGFDPAPIIRACLRRGASSSIRYEGRNTQRGSHVGSFSPTRTSSRRRKELAKRTAIKSVTNRRCSCGSGKMFKNCCGKR